MASRIVSHRTHAARRAAWPSARAFSSSGRAQEGCRRGRAERGRGERKPRLVSARAAPPYVLDGCVAVRPYGGRLAEVRPEGPRRRACRSRDARGATLAGSEQDRRRNLRDANGRRRGQPQRGRMAVSWPGCRIPFGPGRPWNRCGVQPGTRRCSRHARSRRAERVLVMSGGAESRSAPTWVR